MDTIANPAPFARQGSRRRGIIEWMGRLGWRGVIEYAGMYFVLAIILAQTLYPLVWVLFGSLKTKPEMIVPTSSSKTTPTPGASRGWG